jgi:hypothetical protein
MPLLLALDRTFSWYARLKAISFAEFLAEGKPLFFASGAMSSGNRS